ncbi:MAG: large conductance mechanosensitive channel protein MscL [Solirubrobacteraceae bacterium]|nr:large conductance mechanosensitive channel protein MscL [Solirubrobacteraceae bacterium]
MLKDLKAFLFKDNLIDLAVAVILGTAFGAVVDALVKSVLMPIIAAIVGKPTFDDIVISLGDTDIGIGTFLTQLTNFIIIGTVLFFILRALSKVMRQKEEEAEAVPSEEVVLLTEIRDALLDRR